MKISEVERAVDHLDFDLRTHSSCSISYYSVNKQLENLTFC
jgi:hypothetical protein